MVEDGRELLLALAPGVVDLLLRETQRARPEEACGLLFGRGLRVVRASVARNVAADRQRFFEIAPQHLFESLRAARRDGEAILGCWHSHPAGPARPSPRDTAGIGDEGWHWLIVGEEGLAAFAIEAGRFRRAVLAVEGGTSLERGNGARRGIVV